MIFATSSTDTLDKDLFNFDEVCDLVNYKLKQAKNKESDELFNYISGNKQDTDMISAKDLERAFKNYEIDVSETEIKEMIEYMKEVKAETADEEQEDEKNNTPEEAKVDKKKTGPVSNKITREEFKKFYTEIK